MARESGVPGSVRERSVERVWDLPSGDGRRRGIGDAAAGRGLGWFSIALGLVETLAPGAAARLAGVPERRRIVRLLGLREIASGLGLVAQPDAAAWRWARVLGDLLDLAFLGWAGPGDRKRRAGAAAAVLGVTAVDLSAARSASRRAPERKGPPHAVLTIGRSPEECARAWTDPETVGRALGPDSSLRPGPPGNLRWTWTGAGKTSPEAQIEVRSGETGRIEWASSAGAPFRVSAVVTFRPAPGGRGTVARLEGELPGPAALPARVRAQKILHRFKQLLETGMIPTTDGQPAGRRSAIGTTFQKAER